jgi:hypothetical protein
MIRVLQDKMFAMRCTSTGLKLNLDDLQKWKFIRLEICRLPFILEIKIMVLENR